jgi:hypothetical protein
MGQSRRFGGASTTSTLPLRTDIVTARRHVSRVPDSEVVISIKSFVEPCDQRPGIPQITEAFRD